MTTRREVVEAHLKDATEALQKRTALLATRDMTDKKARKRDTTFRKIEADIRKFKKRLGAFDAMTALNADLVTRRAERAAQPKVPKVKKKVVAAPVKAKKEKKAKADA